VIVILRYYHLFGLPLRVIDCDHALAKTALVLLPLGKGKWVEALFLLVNSGFSSGSSTAASPARG
jgi:hypothetical protein